MWPFSLFKKHAQKPSSPDEDTVQVPIGEFMKSREGHFTGADHPLRPCPSSISIPVGYPTPNGYTIIPDGMYPVIRVDGHCFHTFTRKLEKPFDDRMERAMQHATKELIKFFTACYGYTQSDEITVVLPKASQDFGRKTHKLASIAASIATGAFIESMEAEGVPMPKLPVFDGRAFAIPEATEIGYYQVWRQRDSARNAISAVARSKFSHKALDAVADLYGTEQCAFFRIRGEAEKSAAGVAHSCFARDDDLFFFRDTAADFGVKSSVALEHRVGVERDRNDIIEFQELCKLRGRFFRMAANHDDAAAFRGA